jgi:hypothetical protein
MDGAPEREEPEEPEEDEAANVMGRIRVLVWPATGLVFPRRAAIFFAHEPSSQQGRD